MKRVVTDEQPRGLDISKTNLRQNDKIPTIWG